MNKALSGGVVLLLIGFYMLKTGQFGGIGGPITKEEHPFAFKLTLILALGGGALGVILGLLYPTVYSW